MAIREATGIKIGLFFVSINPLVCTFMVDRLILNAAVPLALDSSIKNIGSGQLTKLMADASMRFRTASEPAVT